ncbi:MAG: hypothetical protein HWD61_02055 [Parachlamydiaceae bacterium]|nr:MAG: hypothetical protein HWD61_02055 [Parachlamydiaceae bacterium]
MEKSTGPAHKYHDNRQPDNMLKLIHVLLENGAYVKIPPYKYNGYSLDTMKVIGNLWRQVRYKGELNPEQMVGFSPIAYAAKFQNQYPEVYKLLKQNQEKYCYML